MSLEMLIKISLFKLIRLFVCVLLFFIISFIIVQLNRHHQLSDYTIHREFRLLNEYMDSQVQQRNTTTRVLYAVFSSNTPTGESYRGYDYAFYLPLTSLAWERIGFRSVVLIAGSRWEWNNDPALSFILESLEKIKVTVIFIATPLKNRIMVSQTVRLFAPNLIGFPGNDDDYVITTDSDLWPIRREHYTPKVGHKIVLVHSACCGNFHWNGTSYTMYPMSNIGASVSTWKQIINLNQNQINDSQSIITYFEKMFGSRAKDPVIFGEPEWYINKIIMVNFIIITMIFKVHGSANGVCTNSRVDNSQ
jgi:hypothetical protein